MFEQYGSDYTKSSLNLSSMLPTVNQSEAAHSFINTLFQRWVSKYDLTPVAGDLLPYGRTDIARAITEQSDSRQLNQLVPIIVHATETEKIVMDGDDILRKLVHQGVDTTLSAIRSWGNHTRHKYSPPITIDKLYNWQNYYWIRSPGSSALPDYITIVSTGTSDWSVSNRWKHERDVSDLEYVYAIRAVMPIVEYLDMKLEPGQTKTQLNQQPWFRKFDHMGTQVGVCTAWEFEDITRDDITALSSRDGNYLDRSVDYTFSTDLVDGDTGQLFFVQSATASGAYSTLWYSEHHDNMTVGDLSHPQLSMLAKNPKQHTPRAVRLSDMQSAVDIGAPITSISNTASNILLSSLIANNASFPQMIEFAAEQHSHQLQYLQREFVAGMLDTLTSVNTVSSADLSRTIYQKLKSSRTLDTENAAFQDSTSWSRTTNTGFPYICPSFAQIGIAEAVLPTHPLPLVRVVVDTATVSPINLVIVSTIDGVPLTAGTRVLVKDQTRLSQNGVYYVDADGRLTRDTTVDLTATRSIPIVSVLPHQVYTLNANTTWGLTQPAPLTGPKTNAWGRNPITTSGYMIASHMKFGTIALKYPCTFTPEQQRQIERVLASSEYVMSAALPPIPLSPGAIWRTPQGVYKRFHADYILTVAPIVSVSSTWLDTLTGELKLYNPSAGTWSVISLDQGWIDIDFELIVAECFELFEQDMYARSIESMHSSVEDVASLYESQQNAVVDRAEAIRTRWIKDYNLRNDTADAVYLESIDSGVWNLASKLLASYVLSPIEFIKATLSDEITLFGGVNLWTRTGSPLLSNVVLHGERGTQDDTIMQLMVLANRYHNTTNADYEFAVFKGWDIKLGYRTGRIIDPQSATFECNCNSLDKWSVELKQTENYSTITAANVLISLARAGSGSELPFGYGRGWTFEISTSGPKYSNFTKRGLKRRSVSWNPSTKSFDVTGTMCWNTGDDVNFAEDRADIPRSRRFYVRVITPTSLRLVDDQLALLDPNSYIDLGPDFINNLEILTVGNTISVPSSYGVTQWYIPAFTDETIGFDFPFVAQDVQGIVDFVAAFAGQMTLDGIVVNGGEDPVVDLATGLAVSWNQQLIWAIKMVYETGGLTGGTFNVTNAQNNYALLPRNGRIELNPFTAGLFVKTPQGVVSNLGRHPYAQSVSSTPSVYDQDAQSLTSELVPLRTDTFTSIFVKDTAAQKRRIASAQMSIDHYEHVVIFDAESSGMRLYNTDFSTVLNTISAQFNASTNNTGRPVAGGLVVTASSTTPNFETAADIQRLSTNSNDAIKSSLMNMTRASIGKLPLDFFNYLPVTDTTEYNFWRSFIQEKGTQELADVYLSRLPGTSAHLGKYWAWKQGVFGAPDTRQQYEIKLSQLMTHQIQNIAFAPDVYPPQGSTVPMYSYNMARSDLWNNFPSAHEQASANGGYVKLASKEIVRDALVLHPVGSQLTSNYDFSLNSVVVHDLGADVIEFTAATYDQIEADACELEPGVQWIETSLNLNTIGAEDRVVVLLDNKLQTNAVVRNNKILLHHPTTSRALVSVYLLRQRSPLEVIQTVEASGKRITLKEAGSSIPTASFGVRFVNNGCFKITSGIVSQTNKCLVIDFAEIVPDYSTITPLRVLDIRTQQITRQISAWDPAKGLHNPAYANVDVVSDVSPTSFTYTKLDVPPTFIWGRKEVGMYWWNNAGVRYKPYNDLQRNTFDQTVLNWGKLYDDHTASVYQWVESDEPPSEYSGEGTPYTRTLKRTRYFSRVTTITASVQTPTVQEPSKIVTTVPHKFVSGDLVALYVDPGAETPVLGDIAPATEYKVQVMTNSSFVLLDVATSLPVNTPIAASGSSLYIASTEWDKFSFEEVRPPEQRFYVVTNTASANPRSEFTLTNPDILAIPMFWDTLTVWVDGTLVGYDTNIAKQGVVTPLEPGTGTLMLLSESQEVVVRCELPSATPEPNTAVSNTAIDDYVFEQPFILGQSRQLSMRKTQYYYWVSGIVSSKPQGKQNSVASTAELLLLPRDSTHFSIRSPRFTESGTKEYDHLIVSGIRDVAQKGGSLLCIDVDTASRLGNNTTKVEHALWTLLSEDQEYLVPRTLWNKIIQTAMGLKYADYMMGINTPVPSFERCVYTQQSGVQACYGSEDTQTLCDRSSALDIIYASGISSALEWNPQLTSMFDNVDLQSPPAMFDMLTNLYDLNEPHIVNSIAFAVLKHGVSSGVDYEHMFRTSYFHVNAQQTISDGFGVA